MREYSWNQTEYGLFIELIDNRLVLVHPFTILFVRHCNRMMAQIMDKIFVPNRQIAVAMALHLDVHFFCERMQIIIKKTIEMNILESIHWKYESVSFEEWIKYI